MIPLVARWGSTAAWIVAVMIGAAGAFISLQTGVLAYAAGGLVVAVGAYVVLLTVSELIDVICETLLPR